MTRRTELMEAWPAGCPRPAGYLAFHEWAEAQYAHGKRQDQCQRCRKWHFQWEMGTHTCTPKTGKPDLVVAFPGGRGTADMVQRARAAGVEVLEVKGKSKPSGTAPGVNTARDQPRPDTSDGGEKHEGK